MLISLVGNEEFCKAFWLMVIADDEEDTSKEEDDTDFIQSNRVSIKK